MYDFAQATKMIITKIIVVIRQRTCSIYEHEPLSAFQSRFSEISRARRRKSKIISSCRLRIASFSLRRLVSFLSKDMRFPLPELDLEKHVQKIAGKLSKGKVFENELPGFLSQILTKQRFRKCPSVTPAY